MKRVLYIRRKGFNYYTDYTELYLHNALQSYGYSLIREKEKSTFNVTVYISETEKYKALLSPFFDSIDETELLSLCENFSIAFKSEAMISVCPDDAIFPGEKEFFMFSDKFSAFDEPVYLTEEAPKLKMKTAECFFRTNKPYHIRFVNNGGRLSGIRIVLDFDEDISDLTIDEAEIIYYEKKNEIRIPLSFVRTDNGFCSQADFFYLEKGINPASAVLRAKKLYNEEVRLGFSLKFSPESYADIILTPTLRIITDNKEIFKEKLYFNPNHF